MKSKILLVIILATLGFNLSAQPLRWTESLYDPAKTSTVVKETVLKTEGRHSMKYTYTDPGTVYLYSDTIMVTAGEPYNFSIDFYENDPQANISVRLWFYNGVAGSDYLSRTETSAMSDLAGWQTKTLSGTVPVGATIAYIGIRMRAVTPASFTSATFYADNSIFTMGAGSTANLMPNPGFDEWLIVPNSTINDWTESLYDPLKTSTVVPESNLKTEGYNSVKYTYTDPGTVYLYSDTIMVTAGEPYNFSIDFYDNDPQANISMRLWFYDGIAGSSYLSRTETSAMSDLAGWQTKTLSGTVPVGATIAYVGIRMRAVVPASFSSATFYADNAIFTMGAGSTNNLIKNGGFEDWSAPSGAPEFTSFKFEGLTPAVVGVINKTTHTVELTVPYVTDLTALVSTFELTDGTTAKVGATDQVSATTPNNFTSPVTYTLTKGSVSQDWVVTVTKVAPTTEKEIYSFKFEGLTPTVNGIILAARDSVKLVVPQGTSVTALVPSITLSPNATVAPLSGVANNFSTPQIYTVTAQDGSTRVWKVEVKFGTPETVLFIEEFENKKLIPSTFKLIKNDSYTMAAGEERWADSSFVISTTSRKELLGTQVAMASTYTSDMPLTGHADRWMILPSITLGDNSILSWQAMSTTSSGNYPDDYDVIIAPAGAQGVTPTVSYFYENGNILKEIDPEKWSASVSRPGDGLATHSINLKNTPTISQPNGWYNKAVWIAFVCNTDRYTNPTTGIPNGSAGGSALAIDNIKVVNKISTGIFDNKNNTLEMSIFPNPTNGKSKLMVQLSGNAIANVTVTDIIGKVVQNKQVPVYSGDNQIDIDLSNYSKGIYLVKTTVNGKVNVSKLIFK